MPALKFLCPTTHSYADSGVRIDEKSANASRLMIVRVCCSQCYREHRFLLGYREHRFLLADGVLSALNPLDRPQRVPDRHRRRPSR
jgi:hypothetical protein